MLSRGCGGRDRTQTCDSIDVNGEHWAFSWSAKSFIRLFKPWKALKSKGLGGFLCSWKEKRSQRFTAYDHKGVRNTYSVQSCFGASSRIERDKCIIGIIDGGVPKKLKSSSIFLTFHYSNWICCNPLARILTYVGRMLIWGWYMTFAIYYVRFWLWLTWYYQEV